MLQRLTINRESKKTKNLVEITDNDWNDWNRIMGQMKYRYSKMCKLLLCDTQTTEVSICPETARGANQLKV